MTLGRANSDDTQAAADDTEAAGEDIDFFRCQDWSTDMGGIPHNVWLNLYDCFEMYHVVNILLEAWQNGAPHKALETAYFVSNDNLVALKEAYEQLVALAPRVQRHCTPPTKTIHGKTVRGISLNEAVAELASHVGHLNARNKWMLLQMSKLRGIAHIPSYIAVRVFGSSSH